MKIVGIHIPNAKKLDTELLLEQLRYAGVMGGARKDDSGQIFVTSDGPVELLFPPDGVWKKVWAEQNAERMRSFGIKAEVVRR